VSGRVKVAALCLTLAGSLAWGHGFAIALTSPPDHTSAQLSRSSTETVPSTGQTDTNAAPAKRSGKYVARSNGTPVLAAMRPTHGAVGTVVTLRGSGFGTAKRLVTFTPNSARTTSQSFRAIIRGWPPSIIVVVIPKGLPGGPAYPSIWTASGLQAGPAHSLSWPMFFVSAPAPLVSGLAPRDAPVGTILLIRGRNFDTAQGFVTFCQFCGSAAQITARGRIVSWKPTQVRVAVPGLQSGPAEVHLTTAGEQTVLAGTINTGHFLGAVRH
jgi:hypothetical protein